MNLECRNWLLASCLASSCFLGLLVAYLLMECNPWIKPEPILDSRIGLEPDRRTFGPDMDYIFYNCDSQIRIGLIGIRLDPDCAQP